jgi:hypothetical protein
LVPKTNENKWSDKRYTINIALPQVLREEALTAYHDSGSGGAHPATKRVYEALRLKYWWPKMHQQVDDYIRSCDRCQRIKEDEIHFKLQVTFIEQKGECQPPTKRTCILPLFVLILEYLCHLSNESAIGIGVSGALWF